MLFDDRLATVLRHRAASERAARTQFRQLLDLLGDRERGEDHNLLAKAWLRLGALGEMIPPADRARMIGESGWRFRNPELAAHLAEDEPAVAAAALSRANLSEEDWNALIPRLPIRARGFLRLRRDLPERATRLLDRLGVSDRGLPEPHEHRRMRLERPAPQPSAPLELTDDLAEPEPEPAPRESEIGALVRRIEAFRQARTPSAGGADDTDPRLPLDDTDIERNPPRLSAFAFTCDAQGRIDWAEPAIAPMVVGIQLDGDRTAFSPDANAAVGKALRQHRPIRGMAVQLSGSPVIAGDWQVDAGPRFTPQGGRFFGYAGRFRRAATDLAPDVSSARNEANDRIRQMLHELRTPVNAIQGFAEVIQQQLFGPTPHEYRALAATIAGDSARMLAGFDELDRLARLESGSLTLESGTGDFSRILARQLAQLGPQITSKDAEFAYEEICEDCAVAMATDDAEALIWRVLATLAGSVQMGETLGLELAKSGGLARLSLDLTASLSNEEDLFAATVRPAAGGITSGFFGSGFSLRLARAEAEAAGGALSRENDRLVLTLPLADQAALDRSEPAT